MTSTNPAVQSQFPIIVQFPELNEGEVYAGTIISANGLKFHHIILLPGELDAANWKDAKEWSASIGGDLPDRTELAFLYATTSDQFKRGWYWSNTQHAAHSGYAWYQNFDNGYQDYHHKSAELRARAVRRLIIQ